MVIRARPLHDRIIVRREEANTKTKGGIHLLESSRPQQRCGEVIEVGSGCVNEKGILVPNTLKPGDRVLFGTYAGTEIIIEGEPFQIMREGDVAALVDPDVVVDTDGLTTRREGAHAYYQ